MCGIFGAIGNYDLDTMRLLAILNEDRGKDSFGLYDGESFLRTLHLPRNVLTSEKLVNRKSNFLMGHTRKATFGAVSEENAHPFEVGPLVGTHNGSLNNFLSLKQTYKEFLPKDFEVDSQLILWGIASQGINFLEDITSLWSLSWVDKRLPEYFFLGCHMQKLGLAEHDGVIYYSSDRRDLERVGLKAVEVPSDYIYQIHIPTLKKTEIKITVKYPQSTQTDYYSEYWANKDMENKTIVNHPLLPAPIKLDDYRYRNYNSRHSRRKYV